MTNRRLRLVRGDASPRKPEKTLPPAEYSGDLSEEHIEAIREGIKEETKTGNWKTVDGPAW